MICCPENLEKSEGRIYSNILLLTSIFNDKGLVIKYVNNAELIEYCETKIWLGLSIVVIEGSKLKGKFFLFFV